VLCLVLIMTDGNSTQKAISEAQKGLDLISEKLDKIYNQLVDIKQITNSFSNSRGSKSIL
jgi:hypothetical protein